MASKTFANIDTLRVLATVLLVAYHVVGPAAGGGMQQAYPSFWRFFADALVDLRMPMFAFIAGAVYSLRPLLLSRLSSFVTGKFNRLVVPGIIASMAFWITSNFVTNNGFAYEEDLIAALTLSIGHFWFLQAILIIFLVVGSIDAALNYKAAPVLFAASIAATFIWNTFSVPWVPYIEISSAVYLAPYFLIGVLLCRHHDLIMKYKGIIALSALALGIVGAAINITGYQELGKLSFNRFDVQSLASGIGIVVLFTLIIPKARFIELWAPYTFTIYLYHPFGTSAVRQLMKDTSLAGTPVHFILGLALGMLLPCLLHYAVNHFNLTRRLMLGLKKPSN